METMVRPTGPAAIAEAAKLLQAGEVVGIPTETVYGLAANALDGGAVAKIFAAKGRPQDNPLIAHICDMDMLGMVARELPEAAGKLAEAFWPGPLTMVLPRSEVVSDAVCAGLDTVGVRMPSHPAARAVIEAAGVPLAAPSANLSGSPSPTSAAHVLADMAGRIPLILDGGACGVGVESTVVSLTGDVPVLLRPGYVTAQDIERVAGLPVQIAEAVTAPLEKGMDAASPGMKYKHYAPKAQITLVAGGLEAFAGFVKANSLPGVWALVFEGEAAALDVPCLTYGRENDDETQAVALFSALRGLDEKGAKTVYARMPSKEGVGLAVYNRLLRAAAFRVVEL